MSIALWKRRAWIETVELAPSIKASRHRPLETEGVD